MARSRQLHETEKKGMIDLPPSPSFIFRPYRSPWIQFYFQAKQNKKKKETFQPLTYTWGRWERRGENPELSALTITSPKSVAIVYTVSTVCLDQHLRR